MNDFAASPEFSGDVRREHLGIGSRDVGDDVRRVQQPVENIVKCHICAFTVIGMDLRKIDAVRKIASISSHVNLGGNPLFNNLYMENMMFPE